MMELLDHESARAWRCETCGATASKPGAAGWCRTGRSIRYGDAGTHSARALTAAWCPEHCNGYVLRTNPSIEEVYEAKASAWKEFFRAGRD